VIDWTNKVLLMAQHDLLIRSFDRVAGDAKGKNGGWKMKLIIFVGGTS